MGYRQVPKPALKRLTVYLSYLKTLSAQEHTEYISATAIASALGYGEVQVRKDLAAVSDSGKPKLGYPIENLIEDMQYFLGYNHQNNAILVGTGALGTSLLSYRGFEECGISIVAAFDSAPYKQGKKINNIEVFPLERLPKLCSLLSIKIGIITVPEENAQEVCDLLTENGIMAIWNFAPTHLDVPQNILVQNENMAASLALLSKHLTQNIKKEK